MSNESVSVGIFMGSKSDLPIVEESAKILSNFGVSYDLNVLSAHRTHLMRLLESLKNSRIKELKFLLLLQVWQLTLLA